MLPKICIVLVNYKAASLTIECLKSLGRVSYENYEVVVVDNASADGSIAKLEPFCNDRVHLIVSNENVGFSGGNRVGTEKAISLGADYILLLNNDTEVDVSFLDDLVKYASPDIVTIPKILYFDQKDMVWYGGGRIVPNKGKMEHLGLGKLDDKNESYPVSCDFATGCCMLIHKSIVDEIGLFDDSFFMYYEDADFCIRMKLCGKKILYVPSSKIWHKVSSSSGVEMSPLSIYYMERNRMLLLKKHWRFFFPFGIMYVVMSRVVKYMFLFIKHDPMLKFYLAGIMDFIKHSFGKSDRNFK